MATKNRELSRSVESAREILSQKGNRMTLIGALLVWMSSLLFYRISYVGMAIIAGLLSMDSGAFGLLFLAGYAMVAVLFTVWVSLPLLGGVLQMARRMAKGESPPLSAMFEAFFSRRTYWRAARLSDLILGQAIGPLLIGILLGIVGASFFEKALLRWALGGGIFLLFLALNLFFWSRGFWLFAVAADRPEVPLRKLKKEPARLWRKKPWLPIRYLLAFLPRILLGLATLGIYLLAQALPLMMVTYFCEYEKTLELMKHLEEIDHE